MMTESNGFPSFLEKTNTYAINTWKYDKRLYE